MEPYYQHDGITIYHGDCLDVLPSVRAGSIITDPPYGVGKDYGGGYDDRDGPAYWEWFRSALNVMRLSAPTVAFTHRLAAFRHITGWDWVAVWNKPLAMSGLHSMPVMPHWEPVFLYGLVGRKDLPRRFDVVSVNPSRSQGGAHPCPKPLGLMLILIEWLSAGTDTVLDPFMGSGTTLRAAKNMVGEVGNRLMEPSLVMCPHCGALVKPAGLTPYHDWPPLTRQVCPGSQQIPRCPESDARPLWNGERNPHFGA